MEKVISQIVQSNSGPNLDTSALQSDLASLSSALPVWLFDIDPKQESQVLDKCTKVLQKAQEEGTTASQLFYKITRLADTSLQNEFYAFIKSNEVQSLQHTKP